jgi:hypothetical protein
VFVTRLLSASEVVVTLLWSTTVVVNPETVDTCTRYEVAPADAFHVSVGFVATPVVPFVGVANTGGAGGEGGTDVVKLNTAENALGPPLFVALTCQ